MSDIPIGSPPVPPGRHAAPGGWYPDPLDAGRERYWDGWQWTRNLRAVEGPPAQTGQSYPAYPPSPQPYGQQSSGQQTGQNPYGSNPYCQQPPNPYGQQPANPYGQQYGQNPYGQQPSYAAPPGAVFTADGVRVAGWWWRVLATVLDGLITGVLGGLIAAPIWIRFWQAFMDYFNDVMAATNAGEQPPRQPDTSDLISATDQLLLAVIGAGVVIVYSVAFLRWKRATPGQLIVGLRVVPVDQGRFTGSLEWSRILLRVAIWVIPALTIYLIVFRFLDALWPLWQPKKQALHDLAAKTQVVKIS